MYWYRFLLSLHLIAVICWMAGVLYLYRLFVYHIEETQSVVKERFELMELRLYRMITMPAMTAAFFLGLALLFMNPDLLRQPWMHAKFLFVFLLIGITHMASKIRKRLATGTSHYTSKGMRFLNEVPTVLMILIIFMVIMRPF